MKDPKKIAEELAQFFDPSEVKWKPGSVNGERCMALGYISARAIQDRLDEVVGIDGWQDDYTLLPDGSVSCKLSLRLNGEWITKTDVGSKSEQKNTGDQMKSAHSNSLKRAGAKWGIGRYLYDLPVQWVDYDAKKKKITGVPRLPDWAIPDRPEDNNLGPIPPPKKPAKSNGTAKARPDPAETATVDPALAKRRLQIESLRKDLGITPNGLIDKISVHFPPKLTVEELTLEELDKMIRGMERAKREATGNDHPTEDEIKDLYEFLKLKGKTVDGLIATLKLPQGTRISDLSREQYASAVKILAGTNGVRTPELEHA